VAAIAINARANDAASVAARAVDLAADTPSGAQVVLAADVFYQRELAGLALGFLRRAAAAGAEILVADPGRAFLPAGALTPLASYEVPVLTVLEDTPVKRVAVYGLGPAPAGHGAGAVTTTVPAAVTTTTGSSSTTATDGPRDGSARHTTRAVNDSDRLRRPTAVTAQVASSTSPASTGARNWTSEYEANNPSSPSIRTHASVATSPNSPSTYAPSTSPPP
jgi:hypothetical protein